MRKRVQSWLFLLAVLAAGLAVACSAQPTATSAPPTPTTAPEQPAATDTPVPPTEAPDPTATTAPTAVPTAVPTPTPEPTEVVPEVPAEAMTIAENSPDDVLTIALNQENDSGQSGWATLIADGDRTQVILNLPPGDLDTELVHIHSGRCGADTLGGVEHPLTSFTGGSGFSVTTVEVEKDSLMTGDFAINSHKAGEPAVYTSCGNIPTKSETITIALGAQNDSGQMGLATLTARGTEMEVAAHLSAGDLDTELAHIHSGQCGADNLGGVVHPLTSLTNGYGATTTRINAPLNSVQTGDFAINFHKAGEPAVYTACGNIPRNLDTITVPMDEDNSSGQSGVALLTPRNGSTEVWLSLSEGSMESSAVHIHNGQCGPDLGGVAYPLTNFSGGTSATMLDGVAVSSLLNGEFAVNSHNAQDSSVYTACGNLPSTNVDIVAADFSFSVGEIVVPAGQTITINLSNQGERSHNIFFHSFDDQTTDNERADRLSPGDSRTRQFVFDRPGLYPFYCPVGNGSHQNAGQIGLLRVVGPSDGGDPSITLEAPSTARELTGPTILYGASVTNFDISGEDANSGKVKVSLDGTDLGSAPSIIGSLTNLAQGVYELTAELVDLNDAPLDPPVQSTITFTVDDRTEPPAGDPALGASPIADRPTVTIQ